MKKPARTLLAAFAATCALPVVASAADLTAPNAAFNWTGFDAWSGENWSSDPPADNALFGDITANRNVTLTEAITAGDIDFSNNDAAFRWNISGAGGAITLNGALTKTGAGAVTVANVISGAGSVSISGGQLFLQAAHLYTGGTTLNSGGTLRFTTNNAAGSGALTINGGHLLNTTAGRSLNNATSILGDFTAYGDTNAGGAITLSNAGDISASRTITVGVNSDGTGANFVLALQNLTHSVAGALVKAGEGILRLQGTYNGSITANAGSIHITNTMGAANYTMNSGTLWQKTATQALGVGGSMTLNSASLVNNDTGINTRSSTFGTFQVSGTSSVFIGAGLTIQSAGNAVAGFNVRDGGVLGGNGTIRTAGTQSYLEGVTTLGAITDSAITLSAGGSIRPGTVDSLNSTIGTLSFGDLTWNGEASAVAQASFNLGAANASDRIALSGALTKGTGSNFLFNFNGFDASVASTFTLMTFASQTGFVVGDFSASGISFSGDATGGAFVLNSDNLQYVVTAIPEPSAYAALAGLAVLGLAATRRRRHA